MIKSIKNKKGENLIADFWAILVFAIILLIIIVVVILTKGDAYEKKLEQRFGNTDVQYMLNSYIKSPSIFDNRKTNGEIIAEDFLSGDFTRTEESFKKFFSGINISNNNVIINFRFSVAKSGTISIIKKDIRIDPSDLSRKPIIKDTTMPYIGIIKLPLINEEEIKISLEAYYESKK